MKEYVLLFRMDITTAKAQPSASQMQDYMKSWTRWLDEIAEKGQLATGGNHLAREGKLVSSKNAVSDRPYVADKASVAGYIIIVARNMDDALQIAQKCPILDGEGTSVEIRETASPG